MTDKQIIIDDCPYFIGGNCQEYLDGVCENHKCDLKIIRELEEKLSNKRKECDELHEIIKSQKEEIKNLNYTLYEERNLTTDLAKANLKISTLKRDLSSVRNRFKNENQENKEIIKAKEQECERLKGLCNGLDTTIDNYTNLIELRNQQLDQLKAEKDKYSLFIEKLCDYAGLECDSEEQAMRTLSDLASQMNKARWIIDKLKQTLAEIKEIAESEIDSKEFMAIQCMLNGSVDNKNKVLKQILQKISEVEDGQ